MLISAASHVSAAEKQIKVLETHIGKLSPEKKEKVDQFLEMLEDVRDQMRPLEKARRFKKKADGSIVTAEDAADII